MNKQDHQRRTSGQGLVEYALILPLLLLLLFGILELSRVFLAYTSLANAAREGARRGIIPDADLVDIQNAAIDFAPALSLEPDDVVVALDRDRVSVTVSDEVTLVVAPVIQAIGGNPIVPLQATATMNRE